MSYWGRILCGLGRHAMTLYRTQGAQRVRRCKRKGCAYSEARPVQRLTAYARKNRPPNAADTITPGNG